MKGPETTIEVALRELKFAFEVAVRVPVMFSGPETFKVITLRLLIVVGPVTVKVVTFNNPITALVALSVPKVELEVTLKGPTKTTGPLTLKDVALSPVKAPVEPTKGPETTIEVVLSVPKVELEVTVKGPTKLVIPLTLKDVALKPV
jgi:hypothetical protein